MSEIDNVTGLPNGVALLSILENLQPWSALPTGFAVHLVYIQHPRQGKVRHPGDGADAILIEVARRLRRLASSEDIIAHYGNDKFLVVKFSDEPVLRGKLFAISLRNELSMPIRLDCGAISVDATVGTVVHADDSGTTEMLLQLAEAALHAARCEREVDCNCCYTMSLPYSIENDKPAQDLLTAIKSRQFLLYYQPIVRATNREVEGFEALLRWSSPEHGMVPPSEFIPTAERTGMITPLGSWVLTEACKEIAVRSPTQCIAVNVSPVSLENGDVATDISTALNVSGLEANRLAIEITEAVHLNLTNSVARQLNKISDMGVRISIDDFGTGYSSLSTINAIPVSCIKIDQSFTRKITSDSTSKIVVQTILEMADRLSICTVAEGVETEEEASIMTGMGATALQGYLFGRPLPAQAAFGNGQAFHAGIGLGVS